jgi:hypothetical protein
MLQKILDAVPVVMGATAVVALIELGYLLWRRSQQRSRS